MMNGDAACRGVSHLYILMVQIESYLRCSVWLPSWQWRLAASADDTKCGAVLVTKFKSCSQWWWYVMRTRTWIVKKAFAETVILKMELVADGQPQKCNVVSRRLRLIGPLCSEGGDKCSAIAFASMHRRVFTYSLLAWSHSLSSGPLERNFAERRFIFAECRLRNNSLRTWTSTLEIFRDALWNRGSKR